MEKIIKLSKEQFIDKVLSLKPGQGFDFAATCENNDLTKAKESDLETWFGVKAIEWFGRKIALIGYLGGFSIQEANFTKEDIEYVLDIFTDSIDFNHEGCYVVEEV